MVSADRDNEDGAPNSEKKRKEKTSKVGVTKKKTKRESEEPGSEKNTKIKVGTRTHDGGSMLCLLNVYCLPPLCFLCPT
jgi:hypothetical protein